MINVPLAAGSDGAAARKVIEAQWLPALEAFKPQMIFISAGFDAHREDLLGGMALVEADYAWMTAAMMTLAGRHSHRRIVSMLEGGYNLSALGRSAVAHVRRWRGIDGIGFRAETLQGGQRQLLQTARGRPQLGHMGCELGQHALGPEFGDVIGDAGDGVLAIRIAAKKMSDVVRHLGQVRAAARLVDEVIAAAGFLRMPGLAAGDSGAHACSPVHDRFRRDGVTCRRTHRRPRS